MDLKTARTWQDVLLWGGAVVSLVGAWGFQNTVTALVGLMMMGASLIVWWRFYRCPKCGEHLAAAIPSAARNAARGSPTSRSPRRRKRSSTRKRSTERTRRPR
ncbi:hypothetical protein DWV52_09130 [Ruminococcaceae bacterium AF10-16]|nr:hypothetical protein DWV52_09130 [Ruminococcaceae bacterium AF10-16]